MDLKHQDELILKVGEILNVKIIYRYNCRLTLFTEAR